jgi:hypothetical protein
MLIGDIYKLTEHFLNEVRPKYQWIPDGWIEQLLLEPTCTFYRNGMLIHQRRFDKGKVLLEAVIDDFEIPYQVVTIYDDK